MMHEDQLVVHRMTPPFPYPPPSPQDYSYPIPYVHVFWILSGVYFLIPQTTFGQSVVSGCRMGERECHILNSIEKECTTEQEWVRMFYGELHS